MGPERGRTMHNRVENIRASLASGRQVRDHKAKSQASTLPKCPVAGRDAKRLPSPSMSFPLLALMPMPPKPLQAQVYHRHGKSASHLAELL
jgi:hypothetical protein